MAEAGTAVADLLQSEAARIFSRLLVYDGEHDNVIGYLLVKEVLWRAREGALDQVSLRELLRPVPTLNEEDSVGEALRQLLRSGRGNRR
jgi:CBS domain containing-hemolysin-like protein